MNSFPWLEGPLQTAASSHLRSLIADEHDPTLLTSDDSCGAPRPPGRFLDLLTT